MIRELPPVGTAVLVVWEDASIDTNNEGTPAEIVRSIKTTLLATLGWYIGKTRKELLIATDRWGDEHYRGVTQIPRGQVHKVTPWPGDDEE